MKTYNLHDARRAAATLCPALRLGRLRHATSAATTRPSPRRCVRQPSYLEHLSTVLDEVADRATGSAWLRGPRDPRRRAVPLRRRSSRRTSTSTAAPSAARPSCGPAGSAASRCVEGAIGEAVGEEYVARHFPPRSKAMMDELVANLLEAYRAVDLRAGLDDRGDQAAGLRQARHVPARRSATPTKFRDYSALEVSPDDLLGNVRGRRGVRDRPRSWRKIGSPVDRDEWFMLPQTVNAYYNPGTNEICFPAGDPAEAVLRRRRRAGRELRRHRRGDRPRDRPRLRRPGRAVRRRGQPQRLVDRRRQGRASR